MSASSPGSRIVLVTGASSGIGRECALAFARLGDTVVGVARHEPALRELAAEHPGIHVETCDVTDAQARVELVGRVLLRHGRIDVLVNNAGVGPVGYLHELTGDLARRIERERVGALEVGLGLVDRRVLDGRPPGHARCHPSRR